ncbi:MAG: hypothetical protein Q8K82_07085 [Gemmatimonadaceae bacterium]|nr:hypothetical protein [Gemmatimonadaceae bacterium]
MRALRAHAGELGIATLFLVAAALVAERSLRRALELEPPTVIAPPPNVRMPDSISVRHGSGGDILAAVEMDPFHPERRRPTSRFRLPGDVALVGAPAATPSGDNSVRLLGTVLGAAGGSFAMCQRGAEPPRVVRVGQSIGELTLRQIEQGRAILTDANGERVELVVPKAGTSR